MKLLASLASALLVAATAATAQVVTVPIYIQPVNSSSAPSFLAEVSYDTAQDPSSAVTPVVSAYEAPEILDDLEGHELLRIGVYDKAEKKWASSTSVISAENFGKGYAPHFVLSVDESNQKGSYDNQHVLGVAFKGIRIDAGQTRDFGPQAVLVRTTQGKQPELNKPVVLSPEGKQVVPQEKTLLQKYWWVIAIVMVLSLGGGGDGK
ncbi:hypothetical protein B0H65DRAFT_425605 [Neurospora tetraspora]|uniref:Cyclin-dependent protein kinase regulator pho80 n=1 Tax=Neurospora tetraspora TaxID=94610 RepID=A0AAE0JFU6_9PEZI|nr:hypothetical protein B0H65DRAFT_425605 [Neurospora tetraspora]